MLAGRLSIVSVDRRRSVVNEIILKNVNVGPSEPLVEEKTAPGGKELFPKIVDERDGFKQLSYLNPRKESRRSHRSTAG